MKTTAILFVLLGVGTAWGRIRFPFPGWDDVEHEIVVSTEEAQRYGLTENDHKEVHRLDVSKILIPKFSTSTCPTVENGVWVDDTRSYTTLLGNEFYEMKRTTWVIETRLGGLVEGTTDQYMYIRDKTFVLWRKVPYEIEWGCIKYEGWVPLPKRKIENCRTWIGFREDGIVVWKKEE